MHNSIPKNQRTYPKNNNSRKDIPSSFNNEKSDDEMSLYDSSDSEASDTNFTVATEQDTASPYSTLTITQHPQHQYEIPLPVLKNPRELLKNNNFILKSDWIWIPPSMPNNETWHIQNKSTHEKKEIIILNASNSPEENIFILSDDNSLEPIVKTPLVSLPGEITM